MGMLLIFIFFFIANLLHELGHYITARMVGAREIQITLGLGPTIFHRVRKYFEFKIGLLFFLGACTSWTGSDEIRPQHRALISLNGPLVNAIIACFGWVYLTNVDANMKLFLLINTWLAIGNFLPYKIGSKKSDGYIIFKIFLDYLKRWKQI